MALITPGIYEHEIILFPYGPMDREYDFIVLAVQKGDHIRHFEAFDERVSDPDFQPTHILLGLGWSDRLVTNELNYWTLDLRDGTVYQQWLGFTSHQEKETCAKTIQFVKETIGRCL